MSEKRIKVLYLAGSGRSGSTLVARLCGELTSCVHVGEAIRYAFNEGMVERMPLCGCGQEALACPFWGEILPTVPAEIRAFATDAVRMRRQFFKRHDRRRREQLRELLAAQAAFLSRIAAATGARVIVDSSKNPANARLLARVPGVELHVLHLVRDSRGVIASWSRPKHYLRRHSAFKVALWWLGMNLGAETLRARAASYHRVRYEDWVEDPAAHLAQVRASLGLEPAPIDFLDGSRATIGVQHVLAGNPDKLSSGTVVIERRAWNLPAVKRFMTSLLTAPLLWRYGYKLRT